MHVSSYYMKGLGYQENSLPKYQKKLLLEKLDGDVIFYTSERSYPFPNFERDYVHLLGRRVQKEGMDSDFGVTILRKKPLYESIKRAQCIFNPFDIYREIKANKINIIHAHGVTNINVIFLIFISYFLGFKLFIDCHADAINSAVNSKVNKVFYSIFRIIFRIFDKKIIKFLPVSKSSEYYLVKEFDIALKKQTFTPLCFDHETMYYDDDLANKFRAELDASEDTLFLGFFGKVSQAKKVLEAIILFHNVTNSLPDEDIRFLLVGAGQSDYFLEITSYINKNNLSEKVIYLPLQDRDGLRGYLSLCKAAFWLGGASNSIQEAMACKTVPFLSNSPVVEHLIIDARQNIDVIDQITALKNVVSVLQDSAISSKVQSYVFENYTWKKSAKNHINIYRESY